MSFIYNSKYRQHSLATENFLSFMIHAANFVLQGYAISICFPVENVSADFTSQAGSHRREWWEVLEKNISVITAQTCKAINLFVFHALFKGHPPSLQI